jgi:hypothetical protein
MSQIKTVGELREILLGLPDDMPLVWDAGIHDGYFPVCETRVGMVRLPGDEVKFISETEYTEGPDTMCLVLTD